MPASATAAHPPHATNIKTSFQSHSSKPITRTVQLHKYQNLTKIVNITIFVITALISGFGSAWLVLENGSRLTSNIDGQWQSWRTAGRPDADPYARAHLSRSGRLPLSSTSVQYYMAKTDEQGLRLLGTCEYTIENNDVLSDWWSLTAFDKTGKLHKNPANRYAFNSSTILRNSSGKYKITLSAQPRPGNWLPMNIANKVTLLIRLHKPASAELSSASNTTRQTLPTIRRVTCG